MRKLTNLLVFPRAQIRHGFLFIGVVTAIHIFLSAMAVILIDAWMGGAKGIGDHPFWKIILAICVCYAVFLGFVFFFGLYMSHRWVGPMIAIEKLVTALEQGDYSKRANLRKGDAAHLMKIAASLNALAERLEKSNNG